ncbi:MAG: FeoA family protein [Thermodesulfobacteriota bacterium]
MFIYLDQVDENKKVRIIDVQGGWGVRRRLSQMGIHPGDIVTLLKYGAFAGPVLIEVHGFQVALGRNIASRIIVEEVK